MENDRPPKSCYRKSILWHHIVRIKEGWAAMVTMWKFFIVSKKRKFRWSTKVSFKLALDWPPRTGSDITKNISPPWGLALTIFLPTPVLHLCRAGCRMYHYWVGIITKFPNPRGASLSPWAGNVSQCGARQLNKNDAWLVFQTMRIPYSTTLAPHLNTKRSVVPKFSGHLINVKIQNSLYEFDRVLIR